MPISIAALGWRVSHVKCLLSPCLQKKKKTVFFKFRNEGGLQSGNPKIWVRTCGLILQLVVWTDGFQLAAAKETATLQK
jgi:hypothetical protein